MSTFFTETFEGVTVPALPSGWSTTGATGFSIGTSSTVAHGGSVSLKFAKGSGAGGLMYAWKATTDTGRGYVRLSAWVQASAVGSTATVANLFLLGTAAPSGTARPTNSYNMALDFGNGQVRIVDYTGTTLADQISLPGGTLSAGAWYFIQFLACPSVCGKRLDLVSYVQRVSDGAWLGPSGTWGAAGGQQLPCLVYHPQPASWASAWNAGTIASIGANVSSAASLYFDDVTFDTGLRAGASPSTPATLPASEVELIGTVITLDAGTTGNGASNINDGDATTYYEASAQNGGWYGIDLGSGNTAIATRVRVMPGYGMLTSAPTVAPMTEALVGAPIESSSDASTWTPIGCMSCATLPSRGYFSEVKLDAQSARRAWRLKSSRTYNAGAAELAIYADASSLVGSPTWRPARPSLSPKGGKYANGQTVTIACPTSGALIYYTTDGTTPATSSTLYSGPITLPSDAVTTVKAIAYHASGTTTTSRVATGVFRCPQQIVPDTGVVQSGTSPGVTWPETLYDTAGEVIEVAYSNIFTDNGTYYLIGTDYNCPMVTGNAGSTPPRGIRSYSSTDLYNWTPHAHPLVHPPSGDFTATLGVRSMIGVNATPSNPSRKYVGWAKLRGSNSQSGSFSAPSMSGPWVWEWASSETHQGDCNLLIDDDGAWYLVYSDALNSGVSIWKIDASTDHTSLETQVTSGAGQNWWSRTADGLREGVTLFYRYHSGVKWYYLIHSRIQAFGASPGDIKYCSATSIAGLISATSHSVWSGGQPTSGVGPGGADIVAAYCQGVSAFSLNGNPRRAIFGTAMGAFGETSVDLSTNRDAFWPMADTAFPSPGTLAIPYATNSSWDMTSLRTGGTPPILMQQRGI